MPKKIQSYGIKDGQCSNCLDWRKASCKWVKTPTESSPEPWNWVPKCYRKNIKLFAFLKK